MAGEALGGCAVGLADDGDCGVAVYPGGANVGGHVIAVRRERDIGARDRRGRFVVTATAGQESEADGQVDVLSHVPRIAQGRLTCIAENYPVRHARPTDGRRIPEA